MSWKIYDAANRVVETHASPKAAYRALMILSAHDIKNGRTADYRVEPLSVISYKVEELGLPPWALEALGMGPQDTKTDGAGT